MFIEFNLPYCMINIPELFFLKSPGANDGSGSSDLKFVKAVAEKNGRKELGEEGA